MFGDADLPICQLIRSRMIELGLSEREIALACGYKSTAGGLNAVRHTLRTGRVHPFLAPGLPAALSIDQATFDRAVAQTDWMLAEEAARQIREAEDWYRKEFHPYIWARFDRGSPRPNTIAMLGGIYRATYAFLPNARFDSAAAMESGFRCVAHEHFKRWWPSMPTYGNIIGYYSVSEPAATAGTDLAIPRNVHGMVMGPPRPIERPHFLLTKKSIDPLSNWISDLDHLARSRV
jgi:hypothetical protein